MLIHLSILKRKVFLTQKKKLRKKLKFKLSIKANIILFLLILLYFIVKTKKQIETFNIVQLFNTTIRTNSILIFERYDFHYECTPVYVKYFLDLGLNVDIIMTKMGNETFIFFEPTKKLRFFILDNSKYYKSGEYIDKFRIIFNKYLAVLVQTTTASGNYFYSNSNLLNAKNSIFVYHYQPEMFHVNFRDKIWSWTLLKKF